MMTKRLFFLVSLVVALAASLMLPSSVLTQGSYIQVSPPAFHVLAEVGKGPIVSFVTITNVSDQTLTLQVDPPASDLTPFYLYDPYGDWTGGVTLDPGDYASVGIAFEPHVAGLYEDVFWIRSDDTPIIEGIHVQGTASWPSSLTPPPPNLTIYTRIGDNGLPIIWWWANTYFTVDFCPGGNADYRIYQAGKIISEGSMTEYPPGTYTGFIPPLFGYPGYAEVEIRLTGCEPVQTTYIRFDVYLDPGGYVKTTEGDPIDGATVTLYHSDSLSGPFDVVPYGSEIMAPENRNNPDTTDANGRFGWNVAVGYYKVRAEAQGCFSPEDPSQPFVESAVFAVPPPVTDLDLRLDCPQGSNRPPIAVANGPYEAEEGEAVSFDGSGSSDPDGDLLTYSWNVDSAPCTFDDATSSTPNLTCTDSGNFTVTLVVDDGQATDSDTANVMVYNVSPTVVPITFDPSAGAPFPVGTIIYATTVFTDPGALDTHIATWDWGDNTCSTGTVNEINGSGTVSGSQAYTEPGVYMIKVTVTDDDGDSGESVFQFVVVYDPDGAFVTGGGWIDSPEGAYRPDPSLTGKATFGFVSKYKKGATTPTGNTEFQFKAGDLNFHSSSYDWLVVTGNDYARFKGVGAINGMSDYKFMLWVGDDDPDTFRIRIWEEDEATGDETDIYNNGSNQAIGGGSIVVHTAQK